MALVRELKAQALHGEGRHLEVECTYAVVSDKEGDRFLQVDTYGSTTRKMRGKKSQSLRLTTDALRQLKNVLTTEFPEL